MSYTVAAIRGLEILDSRGRPTVHASCELASGSYGEASVPSGASRGAAEAAELRDGDPTRYRGLGCRRAVANINTVIHAKLAGQTFDEQAALDSFLVELDGTQNKARLGANAILAVSLDHTDGGQYLRDFGAGCRGFPVCCRADRREVWDAPAYRR